MIGWREVTLGDVATVSWGDTTKTKAAYTPAGVLAYSASGPDGYLPRADRHGAGVVISAIGAQCGKTWLARGEWSCIKNTMWFQAGPEADTRFLYYATSDPAQWPKRGAAQPFIGLGDARLLPLWLPPVELQRQIASVLGALDDRIENNGRRVEVLEEMARTIYKEWFVYFRYPGHGGIPLVESPVGWIPDGWLAGTLGDLASLERPNIQPARTPAELFDHYSIPAFDDGQRPASDSGASIKSGKYLLPGPAVLVSKLNPRINRVWLVEPAAGRRSVTSTEFLLLRPREVSSLEYLYLLTGNASFRDKLVALSRGTTGSHQRAKPNEFLSLPAVVPHTHLIDEFGVCVGDHLRLARRLRRESDQLSALRDLLLPRLLSGKIDVSRLGLDALTQAGVA